MTIATLGVLLIYLACIVIFVIAAWYIIQQFELPPPIQKFVTIAAVAVGAALLIWLLLSLADGGGLKLSLWTGVTHPLLGVLGLG